MHAHYLPPPAPGTKHRWWWQGSVRAELGRLALEQQRLLGTIAALTRTTQQLAATLGQQLAALSAERAALSPLDQVRETARALGDTHTRLVETRRRVLGGLLPATQPAPPARMVAGLTDAGAILTRAGSDLARRHARPVSPPVGRAGQLAERLGGELTIAAGGAAPASRLLLRFPLAALPDEVWPDQSPFPALDTAVGVRHN